MYSTRLCRPVRLQQLQLCRPRLFSRKFSSAPGGTISESEFQAARTYCLNLIMKYDSPSYTLQAFIPRPARTAYLAIRALNIELTRIPDSTSDPAIGSMRFQFWRDSINSTFAGKPPKHPVPLLLSQAIYSLSERTSGSVQLSKAWLQRLVSTREKYRLNSPFATLENLEQYAENTYSTILYLTLSALPLSSLTADHLASHIGKAAGIAAVLSGVPLLAFPPPPNHHNSNYSGGSGAQNTSQGVVILPLDIMASAGVREEDVLRLGADAPGLRDAVFTVATRASDHLITARQMLKDLRAGHEAGHAYEHEGEEGHQYSDAGPHHYSATDSATEASSVVEDLDRALGVLMPAVNLGLWLERLESADFNIFADSLRRREWRLPWRAFWASNRGRF